MSQFEKKYKDLQVELLKLDQLKRMINSVTQLILGNFVILNIVSLPLSTSIQLQKSPCGTFKDVL